MNYLTFNEQPPITGRVTKTWNVSSAGSGSLGLVGWYSPWRKYGFHANPCIFDETCMREIAEFCEKKTREHKA